MEISSNNFVMLSAGLLLSYLFYKYFSKKTETIVEEEEENLPLVMPEHDKFSELKSLLTESNSEGWDTIKKTETIEVYKKITESSPVAIIKAKILIEDTSKEDVLFAIWDGDFRREWDNVIQDFHVIEKISEESDIIYFYAKSPLPSLVANREFIQHRKYLKEKNSEKLTDPVE